MGYTFSNPTSVSHHKLVMAAFDVYASKVIYSDVDDITTF